MAAGLWILFLVFAFASNCSQAFQTLCLVGVQGWKGATDLELKVDDAANQKKKQYVGVRQNRTKPMGDIKHRNVWGYIVAVSVDDTVHLSFNLGGSRYEATYAASVNVYKIKNYVEASQVTVRKVDGEGNGGEIPIVYAIVTRVHHQSIWHEFIDGNPARNVAGVARKFSSGDVADAKQILLDTFAEVESLHEGVYVNIFADGLSLSSPRVKFQHQVGKHKSETTKEISQTNDMFGGLFAGWSFTTHQGKSSLEVEIGKEMRKLDLNGPPVDVETGVQHVNFGEARVILLFHKNYGSWDRCWRSVHQFDRVETDAHKYWSFADAEVGRWKLEALTSLWDEVQKYPGDGGPFLESSITGKMEKVGRKIVVVIICVILALIAAAYWYLCQPESPDSAAEDEEQVEGSLTHRLSAERHSSGFKNDVVDKRDTGHCLQIADTNRGLHSH